MRLFRRARKRGLTSKMFDIASKGRLERRAMVRGRRSLKSGQARRIKNPGLPHDSDPRPTPGSIIAGVTCERAACCFLPMQRLCEIFVQRRRSGCVAESLAHVPADNTRRFAEPENVPPGFGKNISPTLSRTFHRPVSLTRYVKLGCTPTRKRRSFWTSRALGDSDE